MLIAYWITAGVLALAFLAAGGVKIARPKPALATMGLTWVEDYPSSTVTLIGTAEVVGAIGLVLPMLTGILPVLSPIAATALVVVMALAVATHVRRRESFVPALVLGVLAAVVAVLGYVVIFSGGR